MSIAASTYALLLASASAGTPAAGPLQEVPIVAPVAAASVPADQASAAPPAGSPLPAPPATAPPATALPPSAPAGPIIPTGSVPALPAPSAAPPALPPSPTDIVVTARPRNVPGDPLQAVNAEAFAITQVVDEAVIGPVAGVYDRVLPKPLRTGARNFVNNLNEPIVFLNFLLQGKFGKAFETLGRFAINSTLGLAGIVDVAKLPAVNLARRRNGFANTLALYGVKPGPFLFLPLIGPTTVRDLLGGSVDGFVLPGIAGKPFNQLYYSLPTGINRGLDRRVARDAQIKEIRQASDPYTAARVAYLERRQAEIDELRGKKAAPTPVPEVLPVMPAPR